MIRDLQKWGTEGEATTADGSVQHRPPPIRIYNVDEPEAGTSQWKSTGHQASQYRWLASKMPVHLFSGIQRHFREPDQYDPEVRDVKIEGDVVTRGQKPVCSA